MNDDIYVVGGVYREHCRVGGLTRIVTRVLRMLRKYEKEHEKFDTLYVSGHSGIIPGSIVAYQMHKHLMVLRKPSEHSHGARYEGVGWYLARRIVLLDDLVDTGNTIVSMLQETKANRLWGNNSAKVVAVLLYNQEIRPRISRQLCPSPNLLEVRGVLLRPIAKRLFVIEETPTPKEEPSGTPSQVC